MAVDMQQSAGLCVLAHGSAGEPYQRLDLNMVGFSS